jgi:hypothetical protein
VIRAGYFIEFYFGNKNEGDFFFFQSVFQLTQFVAAQFFVEKNFINVFSGIKGLFQRMNAND